jgi:Pentapeptide repeats (8 copies)
MLKKFSVRHLLFISFAFQIMSFPVFAYDLSSLFPGGDPCIEICKGSNAQDFSGVRVPKADLSNGKMGCVNYSNADLTDVNFENANLICTNFEGANLTRVNLSGANILAAKFVGATLDQAYSHFAFFEPKIKIYDERSVKTAYHFVLANADSSVSGLYVIGSDLKDAVFSSQTRMNIFTNHPSFEALKKHRRFNIIDGNLFKKRTN